MTDKVFAGAKPTEDNAFKLKLAERTLAAALTKRGLSHEVQYPRRPEPHRPIKVVGKPTDRIDGKYKTTGTAPYAYERHDVAANQAYGYVLGAGIAKGRVRRIDTAAAKRAPGVLAIVTTLEHARMERGMMNAAYLFGGDEVQHYTKPSRSWWPRPSSRPGPAAFLVKVDYAPRPASSISRPRPRAPSPSRVIAARAAPETARSASATSRGPSRRRLSSSTRPTLLPTRATR